jgi:hypothetical protein
LARRQSLGGVGPNMARGTRKRCIPSSDNMVYVYITHVI